MKAARVKTKESILRNENPRAETRDGRKPGLRGRAGLARRLHSPDGTWGPCGDSGPVRGTPDPTQGPSCNTRLPSQTRPPHA